MENVTQWVRAKLEEKQHRASPLDIRIITLRFGLEDGILRSMDETCRILGVSRNQIRISENKIIRSMAQAKRRRSIRDYYLPDE